ncbi:MAG: prepilin-type N-terminal cleavage/methylation domain-containing protein [Magnetococcales bacterium]|nr:prepilin-type N-terminal cleavage/methylation domain-containing protein [Magnetococcales bacterium]
MAERTRWLPCPGGFTLIEMALVLTVFGLVLVGGFEALRVQTAKSRMEQTRSSMEEIEQALLGFVTVNGRLPCAAVDPPDPVTPGEEDCGLVPSAGLLPWATLGLKPVDAWGHRYGYRVTTQFTVAATFSGAVGDLVVRNADDTGDIATNLAVLVRSLGPNGVLDAAINPTTFRIGSDDLLWWVPTDLLQFQRLRSYVGP